ncbi:hypothetical protein GCM10010365_48620 [Streptomyces poonensis]|uniref:Uncharacterized protein n=1 Tax=Streptomyces poonensis TaxID=68255 RepID=A0A918PTG8_9ACTN|nr:hypothetical protein GCM10010365_48620 [Streptomyces poonensis]GLJ91846.1 hypothetical protein GCM10017589_44540 [Streptomyces poonensis]
MLALTGTASLWKPRRLRFRRFSAAGQPITTGRIHFLRLARHGPWAVEITGVLDRLTLQPSFDWPAGPCPYEKRSQPGAVKLGVHPRRRSGPWPARPATDNEMGPTLSGPHHENRR